MTNVIDRQVELAEEEFIEAWTKGPNPSTWSDQPLQPGDSAPDAVLSDDSGDEVALSEFWGRSPALLLFWRHFGCGCGVDRAALLRDEHSSYVDAGANVVIIGQGEPERAAAYREEHRIPCPILCDPERSLYREYGLREGTPAQVLFDAPEEFWSHDRATGEDLQRQRRESGRPLVDSPWQLSGEFVIDPNGVVRLDYRYQYCDDFPNPEVLQSAIKMAGRAD